MASIRIRQVLAIVVACSCWFSISCKQSTSESATGPESKTPPASQAAQQGGGGETIQPLGTSGGAITPVAGSDSVEGAGGGSVGQAAKDRAKRAASSTASSAGQGTEDGSGNL